MKSITYPICRFVLFAVYSCTFLTAQTDSSTAVIQFLKKNVPELSQFEKTLADHTISTGDTVKVVFRLEPDEKSIKLNDAERKNYLEVYVGESHKTHNVRWETFRVSKTFTHIFVYDVSRDTFLPLSSWQKARKDK
ncbi:hypothetical protein F9K33_16410 [bacterium]|nr:MAG: hypothetical protein F9K33_16410 [bacterium]